MTISPESSLSLVNSPASWPSPSYQKDHQIITIMDGKIHVRLPLRDILFVKAEHVYVRIHLRNQQRILKRMSLGELLQRLPTEQFVQVHRSYAINLSCVTTWTSDSLQIEEHKIPISRYRKSEVIERLKAC